MRRCLLLFALVLCALRPLWAADELEICRQLAAKYSARAEVRLSDDTRVDLLSAQEAIEVDWAPKWTEAVGQAVHYGMLSRRQPAVLLLLSDPQREWRHLVRAAGVCGHLGIRLYVEPVGEERELRK